MPRVLEEAVQAEDVMTRIEKAQQTSDQRRAARAKRAKALQDAPACPRCGVRDPDGHECLPRSDGFLRERNGNRMY